MLPSSISLAASPDLPLARKKEKAAAPTTAAPTTAPNRADGRWNLELSVLGFIARYNLKGLTVSCHMRQGRDVLPLQISADTSE